MVFLNLDRHNLATCARVCQLWNTQALPLLWENLASLNPLLTILFQGVDVASLPPDGVSKCLEIFYIVLHDV